MLEAYLGFRVKYESGVPNSQGGKTSTPTPINLPIKGLLPLSSPTGSPSLPSQSEYVSGIGIPKSSIPQVPPPTYPNRCKKYMKYGEKSPSPIYKNSDSPLTSGRGGGMDMGISAPISSIPQPSPKHIELPPISSKQSNILYVSEERRKQMINAYNTKTGDNSLRRYYLTKMKSNGEKKQMHQLRKLREEDISLARTITTGGRGGNTQNMGSQNMEIENIYRPKPHKEVSILASVSPRDSRSPSEEGSARRTVSPIMLGENTNIPTHKLPYEHRQSADGSRSWRKRIIIPNMVLGDNTSSNTNNVNASNSGIKRLRHINMNSKSLPRAVKRSENYCNKVRNKYMSTGDYNMYTRPTANNLSINTGNVGRGELDIIESSRGHGESTTSNKYIATPSNNTRSKGGGTQSTPNNKRGESNRENLRDGGLGGKSKSTYNNYISNYIQYKSHM